MACAQSAGFFNNDTTLFVAFSYNLCYSRQQSCMVVKKSETKLIHKVIICDQIQTRNLPFRREMRYPLCHTDRFVFLMIIYSELFYKNTDTFYCMYFTLSFICVVICDLPPHQICHCFCHQASLFKS